MVILPGDVLFIWGDDPVDNLIEGITDGPSHCAMFIDSEVICEAQRGRPVGERPFSFYEGTRYEIWRDPSVDPSIVELAKKFYGDGYDYWVILLEFLRFEFHLSTGWYHEKDEFICSTFLSEVAKRVGRQWASVLNPAPVDLMNGGILQRVT